ncbi:speckle-type POZ protein B [Trichonephila clavata]|uniref:Speckle-type POZ protein B n=1 Tax=Trichonephila clavata TaxID=2740835 RepID=A0A8X6LPW6_TRICU|nr:speckle-type POZ protein B [Trichonephila clavata]
MRDTENAFTYIWTIENCSILLIPKATVSPTFQVSFLENTEWHLAIEDVDEETLSFLIVRENDDGPDFIEVVTELSLLSFEGLPLETRNYKFKMAKGDSLEYDRSVDDIFQLNRNECVPNDTLTIRCRMWKPRIIVRGIHLAFARSRQALEKRTFFWAIRDFSRIQSQPVMKSLEGYEYLFLMLFVVEVDGMEFVNFSVLNTYAFNFLRFNCEISVIDVKGRKCFSLSCTDKVTPTKSALFFFVKNYVVDSKRTFLPNDVLTLRCEFQIGSGVSWSKHATLG